MGTLGRSPEWWERFAQDERMKMDAKKETAMIWFLGLSQGQFFLSSPDGQERKCDPNKVALANLLNDAGWQGQRIICSSSIDFPEEGGLSSDFRADSIILNAIQI